MYVVMHENPIAEYHYEMLPKWHINTIDSLKAGNQLHFELINHFFTRSISLMTEWHPKEIERN